MIAIPAIDIIDGKCVRLRHGDFSRRKNYEADPFDQARAIQDAGITHLHLVDLDGARTGSPKNLAVLEKIASGTSLSVDFGGGIRSYADIRRTLEAGASQVNTGTFLFLVPDAPETCLSLFGPEKLIAAVDIRQGKISVAGWQVQMESAASPFIEKLLSVGWEWFAVTDISRDGTMEGPRPGFYKPLVSAFPAAKFIGGGGVASMDHLRILADCGLYGAVTGKAVFEGRISLEELARFNDQGIVKTEKTT
jgi:phosphoribosylformimino-5-aminoimidazole carboxamide ribotide isomerase